MMDESNLMLNPVLYNYKLEISRALDNFLDRRHIVSYIDYYRVIIASMAVVYYSNNKTVIDDMESFIYNDLEVGVMSATVLTFFSSELWKIKKEHVSDDIVTKRLDDMIEYIINLHRLVNNKI